jgi:penicillin-binding protein 2
LQIEIGSRKTKLRLVALASFIVASFLVLLSYLAYLQLLKGLDYKQRARETVRRQSIIHAPRGEIYDRHYNLPLVINRDSFAVDIVPSEVAAATKKEIYQILAGVLKLPVRNIEQKVGSVRGNSYYPVQIQGNVDFETIAFLAEHKHQLPGVSWRRTHLREYLAPSSMSQTLGYVGYINSEELRVLYNLGYRTGDVLGKSGIEKQYDRLLRGKDGLRIYQVDAWEQNVNRDRETEEVPPEPGIDLVLTLDRRIQLLSERALGERIGSVVVLKPSTGEILAMVSYPHFDPNMFFSTEGAQTFARLSLDDRFPFLNRTIQSAYPPASTFKIVLSAVLLEEEAFPATRQVLCNGSFLYGDREFSCWLKNGHGWVDLFSGLAQSCDVYFYTVGVALGAERISDYARGFGLGEISGIDLPGEVSGFVPSPQWKQRVHHQPWVGGDTVNMSIGQGFVTATPIQMANLVAMVVNDGRVYRPHLALEVRNPEDGGILHRTKPQTLMVSAVRKETFRSVQEAMRGVVTEGTAQPVITTDAVEVAGKTGTAEVGLSERWHSWFIGYAPFHTDDPDRRVVVVVMVEAENQWEWWAPKAANVIFHGIFTNRSYEETVETLRPWWYIQQLQREQATTE